ncbi:25-hydroxycholesterol 7-alpha-hydroxylase (Fragment) [Seminavis robusta]|uniref:25-hydroxycholesterol 7-alpha-hydroxylase n=1 Tax=Seminavis robusta TaxID=568900 RepID=A0A9N8HDK3_9STRA
MSSLLSQDKVLAVAAASVVAGVCFYWYEKKAQQTKDTVVRDPPHVWSWIPHVGSALAMGSDITEFIRSNGEKLLAPVFTATIMGDKCVFVADPQYLVTLAFRSNKYLDSLSLQKQFAKDVLACNELEVKENFGREIDKIQGQQYHHYLFKGAELENSLKQAQELFQAMVPKLSSGAGWHDDLFDMVVRSIFKATMGPIFSHELVSDEMYEHFRVFDKGVILLFSQAPQFLTKEARQARTAIRQQLETNEFWKQASGLMKARKQAFEELSEAAFFKTSVGLLWASVGNTSPAVFWTLLLLLEHPKAWDACYAQVQAIVDRKKRNNDEDACLFTLEELDEMTLLQSAFQESLRLYQGNFTARRVVQDFVLETPAQNYRIPAGTKLMAWWGVLHRDPDIFENADEFQYDRFVDKSRKDFTFRDGKTLPHEPVIPFGGGEQYCPGRKFAAYEAKLFLAMMMQTFDMKLDRATYQRPKIDPAMAGIGVSHPDSKVKVLIQPRNKNQ